MKKSFYIIFFLASIVLSSAVTVLTDIHSLFNTRKSAYLDGKLPELLPSAYGIEHVGLLSIDTGRITRIKPIPGSQFEFIALGKEGRIWIFDIRDISNTTRSVFDIRGQVPTESEAGVTGVAFHPDFNNRSSINYRTIFLYYNYMVGQEYPIYDRLTKLKFSDDLSIIDSSSEIILIQQADRDINHNSGDMFFDEEGLLYLSIGDEGKWNNWFKNAQKIDFRLFSGIFRIDVDEDLTRSHPIRRKPVPFEDLPSGYPENINDHYTIPNDNPWVDEEGRYLEEFYATGLRNPYTMFYDTVDGGIWVGDVGDDIREEVNVIYKGSNAQWAYKEGTVAKPGFYKPDELFGSETPPLYEYGRDQGQAVIGGMVYYGEKYPELHKKYLFGDWETGSIWALDKTSENLVSTLYRGFYKLVGFFEDSDQYIYLFDIRGNVFRLVKNEVVETIPNRLSELGVFENLENLDPVEGIVPYEINSPLWSDGATKRRWISVPEGSSISYVEDDPWKFSSGTVFIKHFDMQVNVDSIKKLETRFFVIDRESKGYGITYRWNESDTEAFLVGSSEVVIDSVYSVKGDNVLTNWKYPTRSQCLRCHNEGAGFVLGLKTAQLNRLVSHSELNQIDLWKEMNWFENEVPYERSQMCEVTDTTFSIDTRIKSYLDANCSHCHGGNSISTSFDARFKTPLHQMGIINAPTVSFNSTGENKIVSPGSIDNSELWLRDQSLDNSKMPPIAKELLDDSYLSALRIWIEEMEVLNTASDIVIFPNPVLSTEFSITSELNIELLELMDIKGSKISISYDITTRNQAQVTLSEYIKPGMYFLVCKTSDGSLLRKKIVVVLH
ncbi:MAG: PQQ-dependent sugar dehydrogenase [Cyclobacteriaceae bacterium]